MFVAALFTTAKKWEQPRCPSTSEDQQNAFSADNGILFSHEKEQGADAGYNTGEA